MICVCVSVSKTGYTYTLSEGIFSLKITSLKKNLCAGKKGIFSSLLISKSLNYIMSDCQHGFSSLKRQNECTKICIFLLLALNARIHIEFTPHIVRDTQSVGFVCR